MAHRTTIVKLLLRQYTSRSEEPSLALERPVVAKNQAALTRLRSGFGEECAVPAVRSFTVLLPYLAEMRDFARLLNAESDVRAANRDYSGAFGDGLDSLEMGQDIVRGGGVVHGLVGAAIQAIGQVPLTANLERLSFQDCKLHMARMQRLIRSRVPASEIIKEERNGTIAGFLKIDEAILSGDDDRITQELGQPSEVDGDGMGVRFGARSLPGRLYWRFYRDGALKQMDETYTAARREAAKPPGRRQPIPEPTNLLAAMFTAASTNWTARFDMADTRNRIILCALAIRAYRLGTRKLPSSLKQLRLDRSLIIDPFSDKPLIYRPTGRDYLLYSVGPDLKDDQGIPADESQQPLTGDIGMTRFAAFIGSRKPGRAYRRVPHMRPRS